MSRNVTSGKHANGFTLLEISIVLTVIALLLGGIIVGQKMIRQSAVLSLMADVDRYKQSVALFKEKYHAVPGDMPNAVSFWGADASCPNTPTNTTLKKATCNGDGNEKIDGATEQFRFWQHFANAGFIEAMFTGVTDAGTPPVWTAQLNVPVHSATRSLMVPYYAGTYSGDTYHWDRINNNIFAVYKVVANHMGSPALTGSEMYLLDVKFDDGLPFNGVLFTAKDAAHAWFDNCVTSDDPATAKYVLNSQEEDCVLMTPIEPGKAIRNY